VVVALLVVRVNLDVVVILDHRVLKGHLVTVVKLVLKDNLVLLDQKAQKDLRVFVVYVVNLVSQFVVIQAFKDQQVSVERQVLDVMENEVKLVCPDPVVVWDHLVCKDLLVLLVYVIQVNVNQDFQPISKHPKRDPMPLKEQKVPKELQNHRILETMLDQLIHWETKPAPQ